jgi:hypothetical protein
MDRLEELLPAWDQSRILYTTLPGAAAEDLKQMLERGLLETESNGALRPEEARKVVAVESSLNAVAEIRRQFAGLKVIHNQISSLVGGEKDPSSVPSKKSRHDAAVARVINLDFNGPFKIELVDGEFLHPQIEVVRKFAIVQRASHASEPWDLFLTLQGEISWPNELQAAVIEYLRDNARESTEFDSGIRSLLGEFGAAFMTDGQAATDLSQLPRVIQQRIICAVVPKRVAHVVAAAGWRVRTYMNCHYGGEPGTAPMCTWAFEMIRDNRASRSHHKVYLESVSTSLVEAREISPEGAWSANLV